MLPPHPLLHECKSLVPREHFWGWNEKPSLGKACVHAPPSSMPQWEGRLPLCVGFRYAALRRMLNPAPKRLTIVLLAEERELLFLSRLNPLWVSPGHDQFFPQEAHTRTLSFIYLFVCFFFKWDLSILFFNGNRNIRLKEEKIMAMWLTILQGWGINEAHVLSLDYQHVLLRLHMSEAESAKTTPWQFSHLEGTTVPGQVQYSVHRQKAG